MKSFPVVFFVAQALLLQTAYSNVIRSYGPLTGCGCGSNVITSAPYVTSIAPPTVVTTPSVANTLADTLSLLTVSSLLADTLPMNYNVIAAPSCGCGCGSSNLLVDTLPLNYNVIAAPSCGCGCGSGCGSGCGCGGYSYYL